MAGDILIRFEGIAKAFGRQKVLDDMTLDVHRGETLAVIGRSGCGKSVMLKCLLGLIRPDAGRILVDGRDVVALPEEEMVKVRARFGMVFQGAALFDSLTVEENVGFALRRLGRPEADIARIVEERLRQVGLPGSGPKKPSELSGGMKKRVGLARALAMSPEVVLYDEPTTGLDPIMSDAINDLIIATRDSLGVTSIVVTHDMVSAYKVGHRVAMLHEGRVRAYGTPAEIQASPDEAVQQFIHGRATGPINIGVEAVR
ncbi:MAG: ABC transporter ATP-binding protein [Candidatus Coatesbacteria bacterium]